MWIWARHRHCKSCSFTCGLKIHLLSLFHTNTMFARLTQSALSSHPHASAWVEVAIHGSVCLVSPLPTHLTACVMKMDYQKNNQQQKKRWGMYENSTQMWSQLGNVFGSLLTATASCLHIGWKMSVPLWPRRSKFCPHLPWVDLFFYFYSEPRAKWEL